MLPRLTAAMLMSSAGLPPGLQAVVPLSVLGRVIHLDAASRGTRVIRVAEFTIILRGINHSYGPPNLLG